MAKDPIVPKEYIGYIGTKGHPVKPFTLSG